MRDNLHPRRDWRLERERIESGWKIVGGSDFIRDLGFVSECLSI